MRRQALDTSSSVEAAGAFQKKLFVTLSLILVLTTCVNLASYLRFAVHHRFGGDFICFWQAAQRARHGDFAAIYDPTLWRQALSAHAPLEITWFVYPPFSLFGLQVLGQMTYTQAVTLWSLAPIPFYLALVLGLAKRSAASLGPITSRQGEALGWPGQAMIAAMMLAFLGANLFCGQIGAIVAVLLLAAGYFWPDRPLVAGLFIGLMAIKPQLGLLIPFALVAAGQWRTFFAATATVAAMVLASVAWMGPSVWADYLRLTEVFGRYVGLGHGGFEHLAIGPYVSLLSLGLPITAAAVAQAVVSLAVVASVVATFRRSKVEAAPRGGPDARLDLRLAILATGALLATPYALSYDTPLLALAVIPLFVRAWRGDWDGWELAAITVLVVTPYAQQLVGGRLPFGLCALLLTFVVLVRRHLLEAPARAARRQRAESALPQAILARRMVRPVSDV